MLPETNQIAGCQRDVEDCLRLLKMELTPEDRIAVQRRLDDARRTLREIEDGTLLSIME
jgi:hypothetical protein